MLAAAHGRRRRHSVVWRRGGRGRGDRREGKGNQGRGQARAGCALVSGGSGDWVTPVDAQFDPHDPRLCTITGCLAARQRACRGQLDARPAHVVRGDTAGRHQGCPCVRRPARQRRSGGKNSMQTAQLLVREVSRSDARLGASERAPGERQGGKQAMQTALLGA